MRGLQRRGRSLGAQAGALQAPLARSCAVPQFPLLAQTEESRTHQARLGFSELKLTVKRETAERRKRQCLGVLLPHTEKRMWRGGSPDSDQFSSVPAKPQHRRGRSLRAEGPQIAPLQGTVASPTEPNPPLSSLRAAPCHQHAKTQGRRTPGFSLPTGMCCGLVVVWVFSFPFFSFFFFFSFICFSDNVTHPEQDVCIHHSPCLSALFPSGRCLPARGDYLSESSRCRAAGITHGVRFEKGGGRPDSALCLQLFISHSLIYFFFPPLFLLLPMLSILVL